VKFSDSYFLVDYDFMIDLIFVLILSPPAPVHNVEIIEKDDYGLRLILRPAALIVGEENLEF
jgi:hypothetical protein